MIDRMTTDPARGVAHRHVKYGKQIISTIVEFVSMNLSLDGKSVFMQDVVPDLI